MPLDHRRRCSSAAAVWPARRRLTAFALLGGALAVAPAAAQPGTPPAPVVKALPGPSAGPLPAPPQASPPGNAASPGPAAAKGLPQGSAALPGRGAATAHDAAMALPAVLGGFTRGAITDFEARSPGLGAGVRYSLPGRQVRADVFLYDRNLGVPITEAAQAGPVREEFERAIREVLAFHHRRNREMTHTGSVSLPDGLLCAEFDVATPAGTRDYSLACLAGAAGRFVKVRLTMPQAPDASAIGQAFAREAMLAARGRAASAGGAAPPAGGPTAGGGVTK